MSNLPTPRTDDLERELIASKKLCQEYKEIAQELKNLADAPYYNCTDDDCEPSCVSQWNDAVKEAKAELETLNKITL